MILSQIFEFRVPISNSDYDLTVVSFGKSEFRIPNSDSDFDLAKISFKNPNSELRFPILRTHTSRFGGHLELRIPTSEFRIQGRRLEPRAQIGIPNSDF